MPSANVVQTSVSGGQQNALALQGDGVFLPKLSTATRTALTLGTSDKGFLAYDTTDNNVYIWNGAAWESIPASGDSGANGAVQYNDNGIIAGAANLFWDKVNNRLGVGTAAPSVPLEIRASDNSVLTTGGSANFTQFKAQIDSGAGAAIGAYQNLFGYVGTSSNHYLEIRANNIAQQKIEPLGIFSWFDGAGGTRMTLNSTGLGVGVIPTEKLTINNTSGAVTGGIRVYANDQSIARIAIQNLNGQAWHLVAGNPGATNQGFAIYDYTNSATRMYFDTAGNVGIGVTPSAWGANYKAFQIGAQSCLYNALGYITSLNTNAYENSSGQIVRIANGEGTRYVQAGGSHQWFYASNASAGTVGGFTQAMTLDASGNLLVGTTTANGRLTVTQTANSNAAYFTGNVGNFLNFYGWSVDSTWNTSAAAIFVGKNTSTSRSINAGGTVNASGADYAEYMTKAGDFVLSKGDVAGVDANGNLTNVFADAVSFVVKSTNPSYVGNDKWGIDLEGDALEAARQLVDRIAFAGQVPVNVTGAKAGDYIVPVVDGTGIKGIAVSNPTFEQYQLAVGKVIAIDADGRARIIVKVA